MKTSSEKKEMTLLVRPFVSDVSLQNPYTKAKNRKLWSKNVQQVAKLSYSK